MFYNINEKIVAVTMAVMTLFVCQLTQKMTWNCFVDLRKIAHKLSTRLYLGTIFVQSVFILSKSPNNHALCFSVFARAVLVAERGLGCRVGNVCERFGDFHWVQAEILKSYILFFSSFYIIGYEYDVF